MAAFIPAGLIFIVMIRCLTLLLLFFVSFAASAQSEIETFVKQHAIPINTIGPDSTDFTAFEKIGNAIGNARVVMLGEQDHGDAPAFLAKTGLIKYLHEKKGFTVLAFESDFFGLNEGWDRLAKNQPGMDEFVRQNFFPIWTYCDACADLLYNYIPATQLTASPIIVSGFDNQLILRYSSKNLSLKLDSVCKALDLPVTKDPAYSPAIIPGIDSLKFGYADKLSPGFYAAAGNYLQIIKQQAAQKLPENNFWLLVIDNLIAENKEYQLQKKASITANNARDLQMATNLQWLYQVKYPKEKIIVWAANGHVAKYGHSTGSDDKVTAMGKYFTRNEQQLNDTYIIGFSSYQGTAGRLGMKTYSIREPKSGGFENWIDKSYKYAFVDFSGYNRLFPGNTQTFFMKGLSHQSFFKYDWTKVFDGVFFIRDMYPCVRK